MISYKDSGVDIDEGNALVSLIKPLVKSTFNKQVIGHLGGFAGAYELPSGYKNPVILAATDGVGTKLKLAIESNRLDSVGIDLVAMCVNDLLCSFATPMFFLDYYATGKLDKHHAFSVIQGIANGCKEAECALIGGESAEMPSMYAKNDFDLAGFAVGIAEKEHLQTNKIQAGDVLLALPSSGIHSNGYSLVRKVFFESLKLNFDSDFEGAPLIETLLKPTRIYVKEFKSIFLDSALQGHLHGLAHITGGGIVENLPRIFPDKLGAEIKKDSLKTHSIFKFLGNYVSEEEMFRTFNMGVGMIFAVSSQKAQEISNKINAYEIGRVCDMQGVRLI